MLISTKLLKTIAIQLTHLYGFAHHKTMSVLMFLHKFTTMGPIAHTYGSPGSTP